MAKKPLKKSKILIDFMQQAIDTILNYYKSHQNKKPFIVAIDGRCAAGKTSLAEEIQSQEHCTVFHMDDFFLRPEQRSEKRLSILGENVDHERFLAQVLRPLKSCDFPIEYTPFDCKTLSFKPTEEIYPKSLVIVEGSYSCHPELFDFYDLSVFLNVSLKKQRQRIIFREGKEKAEIFFNKWIVLEEKYFSAFDILNRCDFCFET